METIRAAAGNSVLLAAGDTFRAAAIEQLRIWGERIGCPVIARKQGGDASALAFDAIKEARERGAGVMLMDTAGRLQNRAELMAELKKNAIIGLTYASIRGQNPADVLV